MLYSTLTEIHEFIQQQAALKWHSRLLRKRELDKQIADYTAQLEDAIASFQVCLILLCVINLNIYSIQATTLIHIHHMLSTRPEREVDSRLGGSSTTNKGREDELTTLVSSTVDFPATVSKNFVNFEFAILKAISAWKRRRKPMALNRYLPHQQPRTLL